MEKIRLTQTVKKGGCAAKVAAHELKKILAKVPFPAAGPELMIDGKHFDDAAIYRLGDHQAMVQTLDFFTPIIDQPFQFGQVAAANALSDVYAMGGKPVTALAVLAFPLGAIPNDVISEVLAGACERLSRARTALAGGHSIDDDTLKFGLSVTGLVHPDRIWANSGARPGDRLILTKALGTGTLTAALKRDALSESEIQPAIESMITLNNAIDILDDSLARAVHAATDITGFGLSGHAMQMALASGVKFEIEMMKVPRLPRAEECLAKEFLTKAHRTNREYTSERVRADGLHAVDALLLHDPQTSGGLLMAVDAGRAEELVRVLKSEFPFTSLIGSVVAGSAGELVVR